MGNIQICTSPQTDNHASTPPFNFYRPDALPVAQQHSYNDFLQAFYSSLDFVQDKPGEPVPEETFTHSHLL